MFTTINNKSSLSSIQFSPKSISEHSVIVSNFQPAYMTGEIFFKHFPSNRIYNIENITILGCLDLGILDSRIHGSWALRLWDHSERFEINLQYSEWATNHKSTVRDRHKSYGSVLHNSRSKVLEAQAASFSANLHLLPHATRLRVWYFAQRVLYATFVSASKI